MYSLLKHVRHGVVIHLFFSFTLNLLLVNNWLPVQAVL